MSTESVGGSGAAWDATRDAARDGANSVWKESGARDVFGGGRGRGGGGTRTYSDDDYDRAWEAVQASPEEYGYPEDAFAAPPASSPSTDSSSATSAGATSTGGVYEDNTVENTVSSYYGWDGGGQEELNQNNTM